jgi:hypothetical protein
MSNISNINNSAGKNINFIVANTYTSLLLEQDKLIPNTIIISSPQNNSGDDIGVFSMSITDNDGIPARLTYTIIPGNGLNVFNHDIINLNIDNNFLYEIKQSDQTKLGVNVNSIIDNKTITYTNGHLKVDTDIFSNMYKIDDKTIISSNGIISVNTSKLTTVSNNSRGVVMSDNNTIYIDNGKIKVNTNKLTHATQNTYGIIKADNNYIKYKQYNDLFISMNNLPHASQTSYGLSKPDAESIKINDKEQYYVSYLPTASVSYFGGVYIDENSIECNDGVISFKDYKTYEQNLTYTYNKIQNYQTLIAKFESKKQQLMLEKFNKHIIFKFFCDNITTFVINNTQENEYIDTEITVNTDCQFSVSVTENNNNVSIKEMLYGNEYFSNGDVLNSTNCTDQKIKISFNIVNTNIGTDYRYKEVKTVIRATNVDNKYEKPYDITFNFIIYNI